MKPKHNCNVYDSGTLDLLILIANAIAKIYYYVFRKTRKKKEYILNISIIGNTRYK